VVLGKKKKRRRIEEEKIEMNREGFISRMISMRKMVKLI
jgi:hypothetical protein